jgi:hypothetical protein
MKILEMWGGVAATAPTPIGEEASQRVHCMNVWIVRERVPAGRVEAPLVVEEAREERE